MSMEDPNSRRVAHQGLERTTWMVIAVAVVVVLGGAAAGAYFGGMFNRPDLVQLPDPVIGSVPYTPTPTPEPPPPPPPPRWALSGQIGDLAERPALVVKVENSAEARPQAGLEDADLVFEEMVEGGISRYVAVYHSTLPSQILPVRSIRPMDGPLTGWTHGLIAFSGGQWPFIDRARADGLQVFSMDAGAPGFTRVRGHVAPHNVSGDPQVFLSNADADHQASPPQFCDFDTEGTGSTAALIGAPAARLAVKISNIAHPNWDWDGATGRWLRSEGNQPAMAESGQRLSATNVLALSVEIVTLPGTDAAGTRIPETIAVGSGSGLVATNGMTADITWQKDSETDVWHFYDANGAPVLLSPGNTWIELVPRSTGYWSVA